MSRWLAWRVRADRAVAGLLLVVAAPVVGLCGWAVRRTDGGPPLVRVERVGRGGHVFRMWKVRTMRAQRADGTADGVPLTSTADDRVLPVGTWIRRWHLDELPQLANVLAGEMSLIGPRPEAPEFVDEGDPAWSAVLAVPPGIAGATQLAVGDWEREVIAAAPDGSRYRDEVVPVKLALDRWYVERATPLTDGRVLVALGRRLAGRPALGRALAAALRESGLDLSALRGAHHPDAPRPVDRSRDEAGAPC